MKKPELKQPLYRFIEVPLGGYVIEQKYLYESSNIFTKFYEEKWGVLSYIGNLNRYLPIMTPLQTIEECESFLNRVINPKIIYKNTTIQ